MNALGSQHEILIDGFRQLAEFRNRIRQFLHFSEQAARSCGIEPQQHQLLLAIKGLPEGTRPTVTAVATRLCLRHHSTVELVNRLADRGAIVRRPSEHDRREVLLELTPFGEELLSKLSMLHWEELQTSGPALSRALNAIVQQNQIEHGMDIDTATLPNSDGEQNQNAHRMSA
jgi:DNA-binding MarR family transcriptional regulator